MVEFEGSTEKTIRLKDAARTNTGYSAVHDRRDRSFLFEGSRVFGIKRRVILTGGIGQTVQT